GRLEDRGWIERSPDPADGRAQIITITEGGLDAFQGFEARMQEALEAFLGKGTVRDANRALRPFYRAWNQRRRERFDNWRRQRADEGREGNDEIDRGALGAVRSTG